MISLVGLLRSGDNVYLAWPSYREAVEQMSRLLCCDGDYCAKISHFHTSTKIRSMCRLYPHAPVVWKKSHTTFTPVPDPIGTPVSLLCENLGARITVSMKDPPHLFVSFVLAPSTYLKLQLRTIHKMLPLTTQLFCGRICLSNKRPDWGRLK